MGIVYGHAYALLEVIEDAGFKLVKLRNPWVTQLSLDCSYRPWVSLIVSISFSVVVGDLSSGRFASTRISLLWTGISQNVLQLLSGSLGSRVAGMEDRCWQEDHFWNV